MKMKITFGKKEIELEPTKDGTWDIETRASSRTDNIREKFDLVSWKIINEKSQAIKKH